MQRKIYVSLLVLGIVICSVSVGNVKENLGQRWSTDLSPEQHQKAKDIIKEAHPNLKQLRNNVKEKINALQEFCFAKAEDDQNLMKLGQELQEAREKLRQELIALDNKLMQEIGVSLKGYRGRNSTHLTKETSQESLLLHKHVSNTPHHGVQ